MKTAEIIAELEDIRLRIWRLRIKNKNAKWFTELLKAAETLIKVTTQTVQQVTKVCQ